MLISGWHLYEIGLIDDDRYNKFIEKYKCVDEEIKRLEKTNVSPDEEVNKLLEAYNSTLITTGLTLADLVRRPELCYEVLESIDKKRKPLSEDIIFQVNNMIKYKGYIERQNRQVEQFKKLENKRIPDNIDYKTIGSLRSEAVQKLESVRPVSIGQASRISGVSPADISVLMVYLSHR